MKVITYLQFDGVAEKALQFYEKAFQVNAVKKVKFGAFGEDPNLPMIPEEKEMIMESSLTFSGNTLMLSDVPPFMQHTMGKVTQGNSILVSLIDGKPQHYQTYFDALAKEVFIRNVSAH